MSEPVFIDIPQFFVWLSRLSASSRVRRKLLADPMAFSSWYAVGHDLVSWPDAVEDIQRHERSRKLSFDRTVSLLNKVNYTFAGNTDLKYARAVLEGYAVHEWALAHAAQFDEIMKAAADRLDAAHTVSSRLSSHSPESSFTHKVRELTNALSLSALETEVLLFAIASSVLADFRQLFSQLLKGSKAEVSAFWSDIFGCTEDELFLALRREAPLQMSNLLRSRTHQGLLPEISEFWAQALVNGSESLSSNLVEPLCVRRSAGIPAKMQEEDIALAVQMLSVPEKPGINLLLYGAEGLDKQEMLRKLVGESGLNPWRIRAEGSGSGNLSSAVYVAQRLLATGTKDTARAVLVINKPSSVLESVPSEIFRIFFGAANPEEDGADPFDALILTTNPTPTIWLAGSTALLPSETVSRFVFHAPLQRATREERRSQLADFIAALKLTKKTQNALLALEDVSALQVETALRAVSLSGKASRKEREAALLQTVLRSLKALRRETAPREKECVTRYSLKYLNCSGRFGPEQILKALTIRPRGSICLYGPPGTGKTQFVEHLAASLGKRLIAKRASDLLSKYVGENEQNIARMFEEARDSEAVLFLDEGDSFLRDRSRAHQEWEVTKVNELLQHMERFEGIFIVATNLFTGLDSAALRRFTFKLEFLSLTAEQRWEMFLNETGLRSDTGSYSSDELEAFQEALVFLHQLTPGDFATVKRQCVLLDEKLSPVEWLEQLRIECAVKTRAGTH